MPPDAGPSLPPSDASTLSPSASPPALAQVASLPSSGSTLSPSNALTLSRSTSQILTAPACPRCRSLEVRVYSTRAPTPKRPYRLRHCRCVTCAHRFSFCVAAADAPKRPREKRPAPPAQLVAAAVCPGCGSHEVTVYSTLAPKRPGQSRRRYLRCSSCGRRFAVDVVPPAALPENEHVAAGFSVADLRHLASSFATKRRARKASGGRRLPQVPDDLFEDAVSAFICQVVEARQQVDPAKGSGRGYLIEAGISGIRNLLYRERRHRGHLPLEDELSHDPSQGDGGTFAEILADRKTPPPDAAPGQRDLRELLDSLLDRFLSERQRTIVKATIMGGRTLEDVAGELGITRERVRQIEGMALAKLRRMMTRHYPELAELLSNDPAPSFGLPLADVDLAFPKRITVKGRSHAAAWLGPRRDD